MCQRMENRTKQTWAQRCKRDREEVGNPNEKEREKEKKKREREREREKVTLRESERGKLQFGVFERD